MHSIIKYLFTLIVISIIFSSCKKQDEKIVDFGSLNFSTDTIFFDTTVFTGVQTITKRLRVYNSNKNAVKISEISIPETSPFVITIDGKKSKSVFDKTIRGNDFFLVLIEVELEENNEDSLFLVEKALKFITNGNEQQVMLVAPGLNVYFHNGENLNCNEVWKNDRPHLVYKDVLVSSGCKLTIEEGASIFFNKQSGLTISGTLEAIGTSEKKIIFTDDRLDSDFDEIYGAWKGISFLEGSNNNSLDWIHISNAINGLFININSADGITDVTLGHSIINSIGNTSNAPSVTDQDINDYNGFGVFSNNSDVVIHNSLIENCTVGSIFFLSNGTHSLINNTLVNYSVNGYNRPKEVKSFYAFGNENNSNGLNLKLINNLIYGENSNIDDDNNLDEIVFNLPYNLQAFNNLVKVGNDTLINKIEASGSDNIFNEDPFNYLDFNPEDDDFGLITESPAIGKALPFNLTGVNNINIDLNGIDRGATDWDIGAYKYQE